jgi:hypothetical protein
MEAVNSSETSVNFYQTTWRHIPEDSKYVHCNFIFGATLQKNDKFSLKFLPFA